MMLQLPKNYRAQKMASKIHEILARLIPEALEKRDVLRIQYPIITKVVVTPDLRKARLHFNCLDKAYGPLVATHLKEASIELRKQMASTLKSKYVPEICFILEENL
jgi:ribosome-binding factor A